MDFILTAIVFLVIFSVLVLAHEWGHFYAARRSGIKVEEFGFGMPPRIWGKKKGETLYSVNWIPFGGFVKLLGEDAEDPKALSDKRSFAAKPPRVRVLVVTAGVLMNFLLAYVLLTFGFIFGIQPLILSADEVLENLDKGTIHTLDGVIVKDVKEGSPADIAGMLKEDRIKEIDGKEILNNDRLAALINGGEKRNVVVTVERNGLPQSLNLILDPGEKTGFETYELLFLPRVVVMDIKEGSESEKAGFKNGDVILKMNGAPVYYVDEYETALGAGGDLEYEVMRDGDIVTLKVPGTVSGMVVSSVFPETPAEKAGLEEGDLVVAVNGERVSGPTDMVRIAGKYGNEVLEYSVIREGEEIVFKIQPDAGGMVGVGLSYLKSHENEQLSVYAADFPVSVTKIDNVRYPVWEAPLVAFNESVKLSFLTVDMAGNVFKSVFTKLTVPEGVAGPVGIAQLTHVFVQEGFLSLIRFVALLSLSLAIINILPFPALDGGRLIFIIAEVIMGRRVGAKFEAWVHAIGFIILMLLIVAVTYSDILRLF